MVPNTQGELLEGKNSGLVMVDIKLKHDYIIINESSSGTALMGLCGFFLSVKFATSLLALLTGGLTSSNIAILTLDLVTVISKLK